MSKANESLKSCKTVNRNSDLIKWILAALFTVHVFIPLLMMLCKVNSASLYNVVCDEEFAIIVGRSALAALISTLISVMIAYVLALCVERINIRCKGLFVTVFTLPMLIPSISQGMGLMFLLGNNGVLTKLFGININIYGLTGIVIGSVLYAFPVAFLMLRDVMKYENGDPYEAAHVLGISKRHQFNVITFPYLKKTLISVLFATFTLVVTDYGVPLMVGGKFTTVPVVMYQEVIGLLDFGKGAVYGIFLLFPAVAAFLIDLFVTEKRNTSFTTRPVAQSNRPLSKLLAYTMSILIAVFVLLPIFAFAMAAFTESYPNDLTLSLHNIYKAMNMRAGQYLVNSITVALLASLSGVLVAFITAYLSARMRSTVSCFLHLSVITTAAVPGLVLGLAYVFAFKSTPIYGTLAILVLVNVIHFIASPYLMMYNSLNKINENLESVGYTLGISCFKMIRDIFIPMCRQTMLEMFSYFFVNSMMTISAVSFLATAIHKPISLMITQFESQMQIGAAAIVSLIILCVNLIVKGVIFLLRHSVLVRKNRGH